MGAWTSWLAAILALALAVLAIVYTKEVRDGLSGTVSTYWPGAVVLIFAAGVAYAIWRTRNLEKMNRDWIPYIKEPERSWEDIKTITYGHVEFEPFLKHVHGEPTGLGVELLERLLNPSKDETKLKIRPYTSVGNWDDILSRLVKKEYDVVATPLFATFERSKLVRFTAPLFFSNIGLFVSEEVSTRSFWKTMTTETMEEDLKKHAPDLKFFTVKGEISQKLAETYVDNQLIVPYAGDVVPSNLFDKIANPNEHFALFCESFYAHHLTAVRDHKVVNVLNWHQILFPVCFAVRIGDYQLANLLNIRLLQLTQKESALSLLTKELKGDPQYSQYVNEVKRHFVDEWPCPIEIKDATHA
jgi:Bacterial extracellular solute-binding proteins, family 3